MSAGKGVGSLIAILSAGKGVGSLIAILSSSKNSGSRSAILGKAMSRFRIARKRLAPSTLLIPGSLHSAGAAPLGSASETFAANRIGRTALALAGFAQITAILTAGAGTGALSALCF